MSESMRDDSTYWRRRAQEAEARLIELHAEMAGQTQGDNAARTAADQLAQAIAIHFDVELAELGDARWTEALDLIESADPPAKGSAL